MLAFRQPTSREERREWRRRQISRQQSANLSVAEFCRQLGVSVTTFYYWKRRVGEVPPNAPGRSSGRSTHGAIRHDRRRHGRRISCRCRSSIPPRALSWKSS